MSKNKQSSPATLSPDRGVQPAALIARIIAEHQVEMKLYTEFNKPGNFQFACGLMRAVEIIQREFTTNEHDAAG